MTWNWQQPDWPQFRWNSAVLRKAEDVFLLGSGVSDGAMKHLAAKARKQFVVDVISSEALTTSEIEGEILDRASVRSSLSIELGLAVPQNRAGASERGIAAMMGDLSRSFASPLSHNTLQQWHRELLVGRLAGSELGCYRSDEAPMQVVSGPVNRRRVHFEAPPASRLEREMEQFVQWFNRTAPDGVSALPAVTRAGVSHIYFESIHPFDDGNGRIGRAIAEKAMAQCLGRPTLVALAATILRRRKAYYVALENANKGNEITAWLRWFAGIAIEAQQRTTANVEFLIEKTKLLDRLNGQLNTRQEKALLRVLREGPDGFRGGLSAGNYMTITDATPSTARRDLAGLVSKGALTRTGLRRYTRYHPTISSGPVLPVTVDPKGNISRG
ncbi:MAG: Fic family protein [Bryobacterales bacterium]|nr:Fic family protein [Bryobacterales bacterium]